MIYDQLPHALMMIRPSAFGYNTETAASNAFQNNDDADSTTIQTKALQEFDRMVDLLQSHEIVIKVFQDDSAIVKPDAIFPNNWISFHHDGTIILYPMMAENRRKEIRTDLIQLLKTEFKINNVVDLTIEAQNNRFLEGTGSIIFDHPHKKLYANRSARTDENLLRAVADLVGYQCIVFDAVDENDLPVYHTNVIMSIGNGFAILCLDSIKDENDKDLVITSLNEDNLKIIAISFEQMKAFAGNMFSVKSKNNEAFLLLSKTAFQSLIPGQLNEITKFTEILPILVDTIERYGGGSVRCMVAGIHLPLLESYTLLNGA